MGINYHELREYVIKPTLEQLGVESEQAVMLLLATAGYHSNMGDRLQIDDGIGLFGISEELHRDVWDNYIAFNCDLASTVRGMASQHEFVKAPHSELITNLRYATAIAWTIYQYRDLDLQQHGHLPSDCWQRCYLNRPISFKEREKFEQCVKQLESAAKSIAA